MKGDECMKKITKMQILTGVLLMLYAVWEVSVYRWAQTLPASDPIIRVDLIIIYPVLLICIIISLIQFKRRRV